MTMALTLIFSALTIVAMFVADVAYTVLDPRIKLDKARV
jgi:ABC-type dipeptide/oligopeptide/nickel transport system permease component